MPASQKTPNYQLPIYAEEDVTSYLQDFNPAMQKIDAQMKANADAAAAAQSDADNLDTRVTALEDAPAGVTELDSDTDVTGFENGYILVNNNGKLGAIKPSGGTGTDPNAIHASGGGTFSASEGIGSTGPYNIVVDEDPAGVPITADDVTVPESASAFAGQTVTEALESLQGGGRSGAAAENVSYDNAASGLAATNVQDAIDEVENQVKNSVSSTPNIVDGILNSDKTRSMSFAGPGNIPTSPPDRVKCGFLVNGYNGQSGICIRLKNATFNGYSAPTPTNAIYDVGSQSQISSSFSVEYDPGSYTYIIFTFSETLTEKKWLLVSLDFIPTIV